jgi:hypothetical protein
VLLRHHMCCAAVALFPMRSLCARVLRYAADDYKSGQS